MLEKSLTVSVFFHWDFSRRKDVFTLAKKLSYLATIINLEFVQKQLSVVKSVA